MTDSGVVDVLAAAAPYPPAELVELAAGGGASGFGYPMGGGWGSSPPGGMGVTSQGFGQEGYVLDSSDIGPRPRPPASEENFATGVPYYLPFATPYRDSWEVFREDPVTIRQLISMRRQDGQARALYRLVTMPIIAALRNATIAPPEQYEPEGGKPDEGGDLAPGTPPHTQPDASSDEDDASEETEFVHNMFFLPPSQGGMTHSMGEFIRRLLLATFNGFSGFEMVYWVPKTGPMKNKVTLRKIDWRPPETLTFLLDGQGEFDGFRQRTFFQGRTIDVKIPKERALYFANGEEERPFYGVSLFESAFYHWDKKVKLYYIVHMAAQRAAVGTRVGTMPPNPTKTDKNNFITALRDMGMAQYIVLPSADWTVTSLSEVSSQFDYLGLVNHHDSQMSKSVLAAWFDANQGRGSGESTLVDFGNENDETFMMMEQAIMDDMAWVINQRVVPRFIDWNFGTGRYPEFRWGTLTEEQQAAVQDTFDKLAAAPPGSISHEFVLQLEKRMAKILGLNIDYGPIEKQAQEQQAMQDKLQKASMEQQLTGMEVPGTGAQPPPPPPVPAGFGTGSNAGGNAGAPPGSGGSQGGFGAPGGGGNPPGGGGPPPPPPPRQPPSPVTGFSSSEDQALVALAGDILTDIVTRRRRQDE